MCFCPPPSRPRLRGLFAVLILGAAWPSLLPGGESPAPAAILAGFEQSCERNPAFAGEKKVAVLARLEAAQGQPTQHLNVMVDCLAKLYPDFQAALIALNNEETKAAITRFKKLAQSQDRYLAAHSLVFLARAYVLEERFEAACPLLERVAHEWRDKTFFSGQCLYSLGLLQNRMLQKAQARKTLAEFLAAYPQAPKQLRAQVSRLISYLDKYQAESFGAAIETMDHARRRLKFEDAGERTQAHQKQIVHILDKIIKEMEKMKPRGGGGASSGENPSGGAASSALRKATDRMGALGHASRGRKEEVWGKLKQRERQKVLNVAETKLPKRYREMVKQYYKSLQEEE